MQPFQLFSCSGSGIAAMTEAEEQLWQLSSSSSLAITAQQQQQLSYYSSAAPAAQQFAAISAQTALQPCSLAAVQPCSRAALQPCSHAALQPCSLAALQPCSLAAVQPCSRAVMQPCSHAAMQPCRRAALQYKHAAWLPQARALQPYSLAVPSNMRYQQFHSPASKQTSTDPQLSSVSYKHMPCLHHLLGLEFEILQRCGTCQEVSDPSGCATRFGTCPSRLVPGP